jgi:putative addiction module component (TIGR02574 family)
MATSLEALHAEVLRLSPSDRARLLERLILSLDSDAEAEAAWDAVAQAREAEISSGAVPSVTLDDAIARLEARFKA